MAEKGDLVIVKYTGYPYDESAAVSNYYWGTLYYNFVSPSTSHQLHSSCFSLRLGIEMVRCLRVENFSAGRDVQKLYFCTVFQLHLVRRRCPDLVALGRRAGLERKS